MFTVSADYDKADYLAGSRLLYKTQARKARNTMWVCAGIMGVLELALIGVCLTSTRASVTTVMLVILVPVLIAELLMMPRIQARRTEKLFSRMGHHEMRIEEDGILSETRLGQSWYEYGAIENAYHYNDAYYLFINRQQALVIPERCFTQGEPAAFGAFIAEKTGLEVKEIK